MARMPGAVWLGEHSPQTRMTAHDIVCVHTIVGYAPAHAAHFSTWADGKIGQSRDTAYRSAANLYGNHRVIAIENEDHGPAFGAWSGSGVPPLTDAQVVANGRILHFAHEEHGVPLQMAPDSRPGSRGLGYHRQGIDGNFGGYRFPGRVSGGEVWTSAYGKVCPGDARIAQLPDILDAAVTLTRGGSLTQEDPMAQYEDQLNAILRQSQKNGRLTYNRDQTILKAVRELGGAVQAVAEQGKDDATKSQVRKVLGRIDELAATLEAPEGGDEAPRA